MDSIRLALTIATAQGWEVHQMDVKNAFLHEDLSEEIYMEQPHGFSQDSSLVYRLKNSLYDLKQVPRACQDATGIKLSQAKYARDLLERFHMSDYKLAPTPLLSGVCLEDGGDTPLVDSTLCRQLVGSFLYLTHSRPDLSYAVEVASRYMQQPYELHWNAAKCILQYMQGTIPFGIHYVVGTALNLLGFTDSDCAGDSIDRKSTSGYSLSVGSGPIC
eukprot:PITA_19973